MRVLVSPEKQICIFWSPKCGSSSAVKLFFEYCNFIYDPNIWIHNERERYQKTLHAPILPEDYNNYLKIQICRNPYSRAVSSYMHLAEIIFNTGGKEIIKKSLYNIPRMFSSYTLNYSKLISNRVSDMVVEHSLMSQYMSDNVDEIIKIENFDQSINEINKKYDINLPVTSYLSHSHKLSIQKNKYNKENFYNYLPNRFINSYSDALSDYEKQFIKEMFWKDFEFFNY